MVPNPWVREPPNRGDSSIEEKKEYIKQGLLWPYVKKIDVYRCSSDRRNTSTLSFADGHVEMHRWYSETLIKWNEIALWNPQSFSFNRDPSTRGELELKDFE